jgi:ribosomal subunit interface protein
MNIRYLFRGTKVDNRTEEYIEKRLKALEKLLEKILQIEVEVDLDKKGKFRVELMIHTPYEKYRAEEISESIEASTDIAVENIRNQISKNKGKRAAIRKRGRISIKKKMIFDEKARF